MKGKWGGDEYVGYFDGEVRLQGRDLIWEWERKHSVRLLHEVVHNATSLLEVGYATGEFYRYLRLVNPAIQYTGIDISDTAHQVASQRHPEADFRLGDCLALSEHVEGSYEVLYSRDVVHHTGDPFRALASMYGIVTRGMAVELRTRDRGETIVDISRSYQIARGDNKYQYTLINLDELIDFFRDRQEAQGRIKVIRQYMALAGSFGRVLPPDCADPATGTAISSILVVKSHVGDTGETKVEVVDWVEPRRPLLPRIRRKLKGVLHIS